MPNKEVFDAVIVGSGQGGVPLAVSMAQKGKKTAIIERSELGGSCVNYGCTPSKTIIASARVAYLVERSQDFGVITGKVQVDLAEVRRRKREIVQQWRSGVEKSIADQTGLTLIRGEAKFTGPAELEVEGRVLTAPLIFLNTGLTNTLPQVDGIASVPTLDNASLMELETVPEHLVVLGGGYIACEFAQAFRRFGSKVTIVQKSGDLLPHEDSDISKALEDIFLEDGITLELDVETTKISGVQGSIVLHAAERQIKGTHLLVATGRHAATEHLNLQAAGVEVDERGFIQVNDRLETTAKGIYALGDVKGGPAFTHISYDDYRILRDNLLHGKNRSIAGRIVPYTVFTDPELGRVGLTEKEARQQASLEKDRHIKVVSMPMNRVARAVETDEPRGVMKGILDQHSGKILGFAALGVNCGELASIVQTAMAGGLTAHDLFNMPLAHPTLSESLNNLFAQ